MATTLLNDTVLGEVPSLGAQRRQRRLQQERDTDSDAGSLLDMV